MADTNHTTTVPVKGSYIAYRLRGNVTESWRTTLAIDLVSGNVQLTNLTLKQACTITGARPHLVTARRRSLAGGSLADLRQARATDRLIERVVARGGLSRLVERLDDITRPAQAAE